MTKLVFTDHSLAAAVLGQLGRHRPHRLREAAGDEFKVKAGEFSAPLYDIVYPDGKDAVAFNEPSWNKAMPEERLDRSISRLRRTVADEFEKSLLAQESYESFRDRIIGKLIGEDALADPAGELYDLERELDAEAKYSYNTSLSQQQAADDEDEDEPSDDWPLVEVWRSKLTPTTTAMCWWAHGRLCEVIGMWPLLHIGCKCTVDMIPDPRGNHSLAEKGRQIIEDMFTEKGETPDDDATFREASYFADCPRNDKGWCNGTITRDQYPRIKDDMVDGLRVGTNISNTDSISASLLDYEELAGIRAIPISEFKSAPRQLFYAKNDLDYVDRLAGKIKQNGYVDPLIVVVDKEGPYVLEGGHRLGALHLLGKKEIPAMVIMDLESLGEEKGVKEASYFADCERNEKGWCKPGSGAEQNQKAAKALDLPLSGRWAFDQKIVIAASYTKRQVIEGISKNIKIEGNPDLEDLVDTLNGRDYKNKTEAVADGILASWARTSGDHDEVATALQLIAQEEFNLKDSITDHFPKGGMPPGLAFTDKSARAVLRAQYELTQQKFKDAGITEVILFRGVASTTGPKGKLSKRMFEGGDQEIQLQPLSSFSLNPDVAFDFSDNGFGVVFSVKIPVKQIFSTPITGIGCLHESEMVVLGGKYQAKLYSPGRVGHSDKERQDQRTKFLDWVSEVLK